MTASEPVLGRCYSLIHVAEVAEVAEVADVTAIFVTFGHFYYGMGGFVADHVV
jgi:hypothetical protein